MFFSSSPQNLLFSGICLSWQFGRFANTGFLVRDVECGHDGHLRRDRYQCLTGLARTGVGDAAILVVTDDAGTLVGLLDLAVVVTANPAQHLAGLVENIPLRVHALTPREDIVDLFSRYRLRLLPVLDLDDRLLSVIHQATIIQAAREEAVTDMQAMVISLALAALSGACDRFFPSPVGAETVLRSVFLGVSV